MKSEKGAGNEFGNRCRRRPSGTPAGHYIWDAATEGFVPHAIHAIGTRGKKIDLITVFSMPAAFGRFGLPDRIER